MRVEHERPFFFFLRRPLVLAKDQRSFAKNLPDYCEAEGRDFDGFCSPAQEDSALELTKSRFVFTCVFVKISQESDLSFEDTRFHFSDRLHRGSHLLVILEENRCFRQNLLKLNIDIRVQNQILIAYI